MLYTPASLDITLVKTAEPPLTVCKALEGTVSSHLAPRTCQNTLETNVWCVYILGHAKLVL